MSAAGRPVTEAELQAWVDRRLAPERRAAVERWLAAHPGAAAELEAERGLNEALHAAYDPVLAQPIPERLRPPSRATRSRTLWRTAAAAAWLALGAALGWTARDLGGGAPPGAAGDPALAALVRPAAAAHAVYLPEVRHPVEVTAREEAHLVRWLTKRLGAPVRAPHLEAVGFRLVGGRLLPAADGPAAHFLYEAPDGTRLTLYLRARPGRAGESAFRFADAGGYGVFYWIEGPLGYALAGALPRERLLRVAREVYGQLNP